MTSWRDKHCSAFLSNADDTTVKTLMETIHTTKPLYRSHLFGYDSCSGDAEVRVSEVDCEEVYPNVFIGDASSAQNKAYLQRIGITHVLNSAEGSRFGMVNTNKDFYRGTGIKYMGVQLLDLPMTNISVHFQETTDFIDEGVKSGGKVLVHCLMGVSRSSTCVLAYLMIKGGLTAVEALKKVRESRDIRPNDGFLRQLAELDNKLRRERERRQ